MSKGTGKTKEELNRLTMELEKSFSRWEHLNGFGGSDPFWSDGVNMNGIRNHIIHDKRGIKELCDKSDLPLPEICSRETPPVVDMDYMARPDEIREAAKRSLAIYEADSNYRKLKKAVGVTNPDKKRILRNVLGYVSNLRIFIEDDDLVSMRGHRRPERYLESFKDMLDRLADDDFTGQLTIDAILG